MSDPDAPGDPAPDDALAGGWHPPNPPLDPTPVIYPDAPPTEPHPPVDPHPPLDPTPVIYPDAPPTEPHPPVDPHPPLDPTPVIYPDAPPIDQDWPSVAPSAPPIDQDWPSVAPDAPPTGRRVGDEWIDELTFVVSWDRRLVLSREGHERIMRAMRKAVLDELATGAAAQNVAITNIDEPGTQGLRIIFLR